MAESTFTEFPKLLLEMRREVWHHSLPPREQIVKVSRGCVCPVQFRCWHKAHTDPPTGVNITQANREARLEALRNHELVFGSRLDYSVLFNFSTDRLHFRYEEAARLFRVAHDPRVSDLDDVETKLRHVIFDIQLGRWHGIHEQLWKYHNLETLTVIQVDINDGNESSMRWEIELKDAIMRQLRNFWDPDFPLDPPGLDEDGNAQQGPDPLEGIPKITLLTVDEARRLGIAW